MYDTILFDLDGTLTDPKEGITKSVQYALARMGITVTDRDTLIPFIGPPLLHSFRQCYQMDDEQAAAAVRYYREYFSQTGLYENAVFAGIPSLLQRLRDQNRTLVVATSKPTVFSVTILKHFGLIGYFKEIVGSNLDGTRTEKHEVIAYALSLLGEVNPHRTIMVGDRKHDILGAKMNGIPCIAVAYGYGTMDELTAAAPEFLAATVEELTAQLCGA